MPSRSIAVGFLLRFAVLYGLLIVPWPGWRAAYGGYFRGLAGTAYAREAASTIVRFRPAEKPPRMEIDSEILLAKRVKLDAAGRGPVQILGLDSRGVGWVPTALLLSLVAATPLPWASRGRALVAGLVLVHAYLLATVAFYLWNQSSGQAPVSFLPYWAPLGEFLEETFVTQMGPSFVVPTLIWLLVVFAMERPSFR